MFYLSQKVGRSWQNLDVEGAAINKELSNILLLQRLHGAVDRYQRNKRL
jgi:hypothetical protein